MNRFVFLSDTNQLFVRWTFVMKKKSYFYAGICSCGGISNAKKIQSLMWRWMLQHIAASSLSLALIQLNYNRNVYIFHWLAVILCAAPISNVTMATESLKVGFLFRWHYFSYHHTRRLFASVCILFFSIAFATSIYSVTPTLHLFNNSDWSLLFNVFNNGAKRHKKTRTHWIVCRRSEIMMTFSKCAHFSRRSNSMGIFLFCCGKKNHKMAQNVSMWRIDLKLLSQYKSLVNYVNSSYFDG